MKRFLIFLAVTLVVIMSDSGPAFSGVQTDGDGTSPCGYDMVVLPADQPAGSAVFDGPTIIDAWTTNDPYGNPYTEVYDFTAGAEPIAFVVEYFHTGGLLPKQWARGWVCGDETQIVKTCTFDWTIGYLPEGVYLLINYFDPVEFRPGTYDWASKVGDVVFGWPDIDPSRPWCFTVN